MRPAGHFTTLFAVRVRSLNLRFFKLLVVYAECRAATRLAVFRLQSGIQNGIRSKPRRYWRKRQSKDCSGV